MKKQLISSLKQSLARDPPSPLSYKPKPTPSNYSSFTNTQIDYSKNHEVSPFKVTPQCYNLDSDEEQQNQRELVNENQQLDEDMMEQIEQEMMRDQQERKVSNGDNIGRSYSTIGNKRIVEEKHQMANRSNSRGNYKKTYFQDSLEDQKDNRDTEYIQQEEEQTKIDHGHRNLYKSNNSSTNNLPNQKKVVVVTNNNANINTRTMTNHLNTNKINPTANSNTNKTTTTPLSTTNKSPTPSNRQMLPPAKRPFFPKSQSTVQEPGSSSAQSASSQSNLAPVIGKRERSGFAGEEYYSNPGQHKSSSSYRQQSDLSSRQQRQQPFLPHSPTHYTPTSLTPTKKLNQCPSPSHSNLKPVKFSIHIKLLQSNLAVTQMLRCITQNNSKEQALYLVQLQNKQKKTITNQQMTYFYKDALINYYQDLHFSVDTQSESGGNQANK